MYSGILCIMAMRRHSVDVTVADRDIIDILSRTCCLACLFVCINVVV